MIYCEVLPLTGFAPSDKLVLSAQYFLSGRGACTSRLPLAGEGMSWKATYWVKSLTQHPDGKPLTAREKLVLFVLADYHHDEKGFAWVSTRRAATECLTSHKWFLALIDALEKHGTLTIEHREGRTNLYRFPLMNPVHQSAQKLVKPVHHTDEVRVHHTDEVQTSPEPYEPTRTDIQPFRPVDYVNQAIEESHKSGKSTDAILKYWREHPEARPQ